MSMPGSPAKSNSRGSDEAGVPLSNAQQHLRQPTWPPLKAVHCTRVEPFDPDSPHCPT